MDHYKLHPSSFGDIQSESELELPPDHFLPLPLTLVFRDPPEYDLSMTEFCFFVSESLRDAIESQRLSGAAFEPVRAVPDAQFEEIFREYLPLPQTWRMLVTGKAFNDDFGRDSKFHLIVSDRVLRLLNERFAYNHAETEILDSRK